ncbi:MAG: sensor histidine kinase, partial [Ramlibacter sp.]|nr:sensor histidine kinase [Ramlibacter sp.]
FDLDGLHRHLEPAPLERLQRAQSVLAQATETTQRLMRNLRPPILDAGLASALESLVREFRQRTGIAIEFHANASQEPLNANASLTLYRTCQEALTNVAKHAVARNVTVDLHHGSDAVSLEIIDDGRGLASGSLQKPGSLGLRGIAERAHAAAGTLDISSRDARTTLMLWLPIVKEAA